MATTQYIGARYVPLFADPAEWDSTKQYEPLTIVLHEGNSYTSKQYVPAGIEITNEKFWALTGNYNAQVESYRQEVTTFNDRITTNTNNIAATNNALNTVMPLDTTPTNGSTKGITSDGVFNAVDTVLAQVSTNSSDIGFLKNAMLLKGKKAVVFGDSTAANQPSYFTQLAEKTGMEITNRAIAGTSLSQNDSYTWDTIPTTGNSGYALIRQQTDLANFDIVFLAYSTNDWQAGFRLKNAGMESAKRISFEGALRKTVEYIQSKAPSAFVVFVAPAYGYRVWPGSYPNVNPKGFTLRDYAIVAQNVMHEMGMGFIDLGNVGVNINNYRNWLYDDSGGIFVHYNERLKPIIVNAIIGSYPWKPDRVCTPDAEFLTTYSQTYINPISLATPLDINDTEDTAKLVPRNIYLAADSSFRCTANMLIDAGSSTVYLTPEIDFTDGLDALVYIINTAMAEPFTIEATNTDYKAVYSTVDYGWVAVHIPPTDARGRLKLAHQSVSATGQVIASCVAKADNVLCMPRQILYYNLSKYINSDNGTVQGSCGYSDTFHFNVNVKNHGNSMILFNSLPKFLPAPTTPRFNSYNTYVQGGVGWLAAAWEYLGVINLFTDNSNSGADWQLIV